MNGAAQANETRSTSILDLLKEETFPAQKNGSGKAKAPERGQKPTATNDSQNNSTTAPHHTAARSDAARLVELAKSFRYFHDPLDRAFVQLDVNGHAETWPVKSVKFQNLLGKIFYQREGRIINRNSLGDAIGTLVGIAAHDGPEESVCLRVAPHGDNILVDLCDDRWRVIEVRPGGWSVLDRSPVPFIRTGSMAALPEPIPGAGSIEPLWELLNVAPEQRVLIAGALLNYFNPQGPYFVTNLVGEQGAAKSSAARIMRQLVDPNANPLRSPPKEERDLFAQANSNHVVALDNLSTLPVWLSDALCRLATGGGHSARALYSDLEEISVCFKRPVILNGIDDVAVRTEIQERVLQVELEEIPKERRLSERELFQRFNEARPAIFTALLDALSG